jgi:methionyl-tRNA formyltransferase
VIKVAYFGLPLAALLLERDGIALEFAVLPKLDAPGRRRLTRRLGDRVVDARHFDDASALSTEVDARFTRGAPDLIVSWFYPRRLPTRWLDQARLGAIGAHPSLLPRHRGPNPFFAAIDAGDALTGVTVHRLVAAYDEGDMLLTETLEVGERNSWQLARALDRPSLRLLRIAARALTSGASLSGTPQDEASATWAPEPDAELLHADFRWPTERVLRRIRALSPVPGLALEIKGEELFVTRARVADEYPPSLHPGEAAILDVGVVIRTGDGAFLVERAAVTDTEDDEPHEITALSLRDRLRRVSAREA